MNTSVKLLEGPPHRAIFRQPSVLLATLIAALVLAVWLAGDTDDAASDIVLAANSQKAETTGVTLAVPEFAQRKIVAIARDLFASQSWLKPPPPVVVRASAPAAPTAPPLRFKLIGSYEHSGDATVYFLVQGDVVRDVHVGDVLDGTYSVDSAQNGRLQMTYLPLKIRQEIAVGSN